MNVDLKSFKYFDHSDAEVFGMDKNGIFFNGEFIKTDTTGFISYGKTEDENWLWKTKKNVFKNTTSIKSIHAESFQRLKTADGKIYHGFHFKDHKNIYYFDKILEGLNIDSTFVYDSSVLYDNNYYYALDVKKYFNLQPIKHVNNSLQKTNTIVIDYWNNITFPHIDSETIIGLSRYYSKDKNNIYFKSEILPIDITNANKLKIWDWANTSFIFTGEKLFWNNIEVFNIDDRSFGVLKNADIFFDKNGIYEKKWNNGLFDFVRFPFNYTEPVNEYNTSIKNGYIIYTNQAYDSYKKILYENLTQSQLDKLGIENIGLIKINDVAETVIKYNYQVSKSENKVYWNDLETSADAHKFEPVPNSVYYFRDNSFVYQYTNKGLIPIEDIDTKSVIEKYGFLIDKNFLYNSNSKIMKSKDIELLAIYGLNELECGVGASPYSNIYYLFKNVDGYWLVFNGESTKVKNLGRKIPEFLKL